MSRVNHNANYIFDVEGETVWEKLRAIRGMLLDRQMAYELAILNREEQASKNTDENSFEYKKMIIQQKQQDILLKECLEEINFLKEYEAFLANEAEETRIPGKTDDEMYEINFFEELKQKLVRKSQAQMISYGRIQDDLMFRLLKHEEALTECINQGLLTEEVRAIANCPTLSSPLLMTTNFINQKLLN